MHVTENSKWYFIWSQFQFYNATNIHDIYNACLFRWTEYFIDYVMPLSRFIISCFGVNFRLISEWKKYDSFHEREPCDVRVDIWNLPNLHLIKMFCAIRIHNKNQCSGIWVKIDRSWSKRKKKSLTLSNECVLCAFCSDKLKTVQNFHHLGNVCWIRGKQCFNE